MRIILEKLRHVALFFLCTMIAPVYAQDEPLRIATTHFSPPFVMQGTNQLYGFDIVMMERICAIIQRSCKFQTLRFDDVFTAVENNTADVGVSAITITADRAKVVAFSLPYMLSESSFLGPSKLKSQPLTMKLLQSSKIGVEIGSIFADQIKLLGITNATIVTYNQESDVIEALNDGDVDLALVDAPSAHYWQAESSGALAAIGNPLSFGSGLGIAINLNNTTLLEQINQALLQYQKSPDFKKDYQMYLQQF